MTTGTNIRFRLNRTDLVAAGLALVAGVVALRDPSALAPAWRCIVFLGLGPTIGALALACVHSMTGGEWGRSLRPGLMAGCRLLPLMVALGIPLVAVRAVSSSGERGFNAPGFVAARAVVLGLLLVALARGMRHEWPESGHRPTMRWLGPLGLIAVFFINHVLADDWLAPADGAPSGTAFPLIWILGQAVTALALSILVALGRGFDPRRVLAGERTLGNDVGNLLFAAVMMWCYVAFAHFLIIWSGNLPREVAWYVDRIGPIWKAVPLILVGLHLAAPMIVLLSRPAKNSQRALTVVALLLVGAQSLYTCWIFLPVASIGSTLIAILLAIGLGGVGGRAGWRLAHAEGGAP